MDTLNIYHAKHSAISIMTNSEKYKLSDSPIKCWGITELDI